MGKVGEIARKRYQERVQEYRAAASAIAAEEGKVAPTLVKGDLNQTDKRLLLAEKSLNLGSYYLILNALSLRLLGVKDDAKLNEARKCLYRTIIYLEDVVSNYVDAPFSDYEEGVFAVDQVLGDKEKHDLLRKIGYSVDSVRDALGENNRWRWSIVDVQGRFTVVAKNMLNFKTMIEKLDPNHKSYPYVLGHIDLVKRHLAQSADEYRQKYELTTRRHDDMQMGINYLSALRRIHMLLGEAEDAEAVKRKLDVWQHKLNTDMKGKKQQEAGRPKTR
jgi:hypothetical protein